MNLYDELGGAGDLPPHPDPWGAVSVRLTTLKRRRRLRVAAAGAVTSVVVLGGAGVVLASGGSNQATPTLVVTTPTVTETPTQEPSPTETPSPAPTATASATADPTITPAPPDSATPTPTPTETPVLGLGGNTGPGYEDQTVTIDAVLEAPTTATVGETLTYQVRASWSAQRPTFEAESTGGRGGGCLTEPGIARTDPAPGTAVFTDRATFPYAGVIRVPLHVATSCATDHWLGSAEQVIFVTVTDPNATPTATPSATPTPTDTPSTEPTPTPTP